MMSIPSSSFKIFQAIDHDAFATICHTIVYHGQAAIQLVFRILFSFERSFFILFLSDIPAFVNEFLRIVLSRKALDRDRSWEIRGLDVFLAIDWLSRIPS